MRCNDFRNRSVLLSSTYAPFPPLHSLAFDKNPLSLTLVGRSLVDRLSNTCFRFCRREFCYALRGHERLLDCFRHENWAQAKDTISVQRRCHDSQGHGYAGYSSCHLMQLWLVTDSRGSVNGFGFLLREKLGWATGCHVQWRMLSTYFARTCYDSAFPYLLLNMCGIHDNNSGCGVGARHDG